MLKQRHERALALALNFGLVMGMAGVSFESYAAPMQDEDDKEPPNVSIVSPEDGAVVAIGDPFFVRVNATDNVIVKKVHLHMNGTDVGSIDGAADAIYSFQVKDIQEGEYTIKTVVYDLAGNSASSEEITVSGVKSDPKDEEEDQEKKENEVEKGEVERGKSEVEKEKGSGEGSKEKSGGEGSGDEIRGEGSQGNSGGEGSLEKSNGEDQGEEKPGAGDKSKGRDEVGEKDKFGRDTPGKGSSPQQGNDGQFAAKGCAQGSKRLPLWSGLGLLVFGADPRRR